MVVAIKAQHNHTQIARFLKVDRSFVANVRKHLEAADRDPTLAAKLNNIVLVHLRAGTYGIVKLAVDIQ